MKGIGCVVVTYNPDEGFVKSINSLISQVDSIIVVDNGSSKSNYDIINKIVNDNSSVSLIKNSENLGIASALNIGCKRALDIGYKWILTMDQDSMAAEDMVDNMLRVYEAIDESEKSQILSIFPTFVDQRVQTIEENLSEKEYEYVDAEITSGNLLKVQVFDKVGFFDDELFIDLVDTDFCMRLNQANIKMIKVRDALLYHNLGESNKVNKGLIKFNTSNHSALRRYYMTRNRLYTWKKYKDLNSFTLNRDKLLFKKEFVKIILGEEDKLNKVKMIYRGYKDYKNGIKGKFIP